MAAVVASPDGAPVAIPVRAGRLDTVWTATRALAAGSRLAEGDAQTESRILWGPPRGGTPERPAPGWEVRRDLARGDLLIEPAVEPPALIEPGEAVQLIWSRGTVRLSLAGRALNRARQGEAVRVRIPGRERPLTATAVESGVAEIDPGGSR
jgi:flagella basal body P-ring formation protein FlgA